MKKFSLPLFVSLAAIVVFVLGGCAIPLPKTDYLFGTNEVHGTISGVPDVYGNPVTVTDDLGESAVSEYSSYLLCTKPGIRTLTYSCAGCATVSTVVSVIGRICVDVTMKPVANAGGPR